MPLQAATTFQATANVTLKGATLTVSGTAGITLKGGTIDGLTTVSNQLPEPLLPTKRVLDDGRVKGCDSRNHDRFLAIDDSAARSLYE